jgi:hypothetical protein
MQTYSFPRAGTRKKGWPKVFLETLARVGTVSHACQAAGVNITTAWRMRQSDPGFDQACQDAERRFTDRAERELFRRAIDGVEEPIYQGGKLVGTRLVYSDSLLLAVVKARKPDLYRDRSTVEHALAGPVVDARRQRAILADPEAARLACELDARLAQRALPAPTDEKPPESQDSGGQGDQEGQ